MVGYCVRVYVHYVVFGNFHLDVILVVLLAPGKVNKGMTLSREREFDPVVNTLLPDKTNSSFLGQIIKGKPKTVNGMIQCLIHILKLHVH